MKVLIACEFSGIVRSAFRRRGHDAWSCDLLPAEDGSPYHIQDDVRYHLDRGWDIIIAHPPCTRLTNSGVRWLDERNLWKEMEEGAEFFNLFKKADCKKIAIENPIPHKYARDIIGEYLQIVQPWMFGDNESKAICLWLYGLPKLKPQVTIKPANMIQRVWKMPPGPDRAKERSRFFCGVANAMAEQWGGERPSDLSIGHPQSNS